MKIEDLAKKLSKGTKGIYSEVLSKSRIGSITEYIPSDFYDLNRIATGNLFQFAPNGKIVGVAAPEGTGKTLLVLNLIKNAQRMGYTCVACETEGAWEKDFVRRWGVNAENLSYNYMNTIEDFRIFCQNFEDLLEKKDPKEKYFWCLDSLGTLMTRFEIEKKDAGKVYVDRGLLQRHIKSVFKHISRICNIYSVPFIFTNHLVADPAAPNQYVTEEMVGGKAPKLLSWMIFYMRKSLKKEDKDVVGTQIDIKNRKNRQYPPFQDAIIDLDFKKGANAYAGLSDLALNLGYFGKSDKYYVVPKEPRPGMDIYQIPEDETKKMFGVSIMKEPEKIFTKEVMEHLNTKLDASGYHTVDQELASIFEEKVEDKQEKIEDKQDENRNNN